MDQSNYLRRTLLLAAGVLCVGLSSAPQHCGAEEGAALAGRKVEAQAEPDVLTIDGVVVDEEGTRVPNIRVRLLSFSGSPRSALADAEGRFRFSVDIPTTRFLTFVADSLKGGKRGYLQIAEEGTLGLTSPLQLVLKPPRPLTIQVRDAKGEPIKDTQVVVSDPLMPISEGRTGPDGNVIVSVPVDVKVESVVALKSGAGFDSWCATVQPGGPRQDVPDRLELTLDGARPVRVHVVDSAGRGIPQISIVPWTIQKEGRSSYANLSGFGDRLDNTRTDAQGVVTVDWLPAKFGRKIGFLMTSEGYHLPRPPSYADNEEGDPVELTMPLLRTTPISGKVLDAEGRPAAGIRLQAEGRRGNHHYFRGFARTNAAGEFEFQAYPDQAYLVAVLNAEWGATSQTLPPLVEDQPIKGLVFHLGPGTVVRGVAKGADGQPLVNKIVTLVQDSSTPELPGEKLNLVRWAHTDSEGRYHFRVGPGDYELLSPGHEVTIPLKIEKQPELVQHFQAKKSE